MLRGELCELLQNVQRIGQAVEDIDLAVADVDRLPLYNLCAATLFRIPVIFSFSVAPSEISTLCSMFYCSCFAIS